MVVMIIGLAASGCSDSTHRRAAPSAASSPAAAPNGDPTAPGGSTRPTTRSLSPTTIPSVATTSPPAPIVGTVTAATPADLPYSWRPGCPVGPGELRLLHLNYWGFDGVSHVGTMVVNAVVTADVLKIFGQLYAVRFPIHQMQPVDAYRASDPDSMAADNTSGFNCRNAVAPGPPQWSVHAFGEAIDVNTVENPYIQGGTVTPAAGAAFLNRSDIRPGMAVPSGPLVQAFASAGWQWGGRWTASPDYQHFSRTGG
jgi:hypothetical protein